MNQEILFNFILALAGIIMILAAASDAVRYRIPNLASLGLLLLFPIFVYAAPITILWKEHLIVFGVILVLGYLVFLKNWVGAGDIKLLAVVGLWAGPTYVGSYLFITAITGGLLALGMAATGLARQRFSKKGNDVAPLSKTPIPYGVAIAVGGLCALVMLSHPELLQAKV